MKGIWVSVVSELMVLNMIFDISKLFHCLAEYSRLEESIQYFRIAQVGLKYLVVGIILPTLFRLVNEICFLENFIFLSYFIRAVCKYSE